MAIGADSLLKAHHSSLLNMHFLLYCSNSIKPRIVNIHKTIKYTECKPKPLSTTNHKILSASKDQFTELLTRCIHIKRCPNTQTKIHALS